MSIMSKFQTGNRGDTIVEVMIVLAILSLALSICYATANRSLLNNRQAQENGEATKVAQSQIEALRTMTELTGADDIKVPGPFCAAYDSTANPPGYKVYPFALPNYPPQCTTDSLYNTSITYDSATHTYTVVVSWPDVIGDPNDDTVTLYYRVYAL
jgi:prepilin-type N-terminal cleavage/methylation domain-containing protein